MDDRASDRDLLLLAGGQALRPLLGERAHVEPVDHAVHPSLHLSVEHTRQLGKVRDVLACAEAWVDADLRGDHADPTPHLLGRHAGVVTKDLNRS